MGIRLFIVIISSACFFVPATGCLAAAAGDKTAAAGGGDSYIGMSRSDLLDIYKMGNVKEYEKKDNEEVIVFDDIFTSNPGDTITFNLTGGKVDSFDKNIITFLTDTGLQAALYAGMPKADLLKIYHPGNLKAYSRNANEEIMVFDDILTSDPDDTITFHIADGKVKKWDKKTAVFEKSAQLKAAEERSRYAHPAGDYVPYEYQVMQGKQGSRRSSVRSSSWGYRSGLYYRYR